MKPEMTKLCINCSHHSENHGIHTCQAEEQGVSLVTGEPIRLDCGMQRTLESTGCGREARWFLTIHKESVEFPPRWSSFAEAMREVKG